MFLWWANSSPCARSRNNDGWLEPINCLSTFSSLVMWSSLVQRVTHNPFSGFSYIICDQSDCVKSSPCGCRRVFSGRMPGQTPRGQCNWVSPAVEQNTLIWQKPKASLNQKHSAITLPHNHMNWTTGSKAWMKGRIASSHWWGAHTYLSQCHQLNTMATTLWH